MSYKLLLQLGIVLGIGVLFSHTAFADEQDDKLFALLKNTPGVSLLDSPLKSQYFRIDKEVREFVPKQTMIEMQRLLEHDRKEGLTKFTDSALSRLLPQNCLPKTAGGVSSVQGTTQGINDSTHYQKKCEEITALNERFGQKISSIRYQNVFSDGDTKNSGFDLLNDIALLKEKINGAKDRELPGWTRDISPDAKYLTGNWYKPEYVQVPASSLADTMKSFSFSNTDPNTLGFCPLPGAAPVTASTQTFSEPEKEAISKSFARFERAKTTPDPSFDNEAVLKKDTSNILSAAQKILNDAQQSINGTVENLDKWNCLWESFCIKVYFQTGFADEAGTMFTTRRVGLDSPALRTSLTKLSDATSELSAQNLQLKNEPRAIFSFGWQDLKFEVPDNFLQISWVPIVPRVDKADFTDPDLIGLLGKMWNAVAGSNNASDAVAPANIASGDYAAQYANMLAKQKETKELAIKLQTQQINAKNLTDYEEVIGGQLTHLTEELQALLTQMEALKKISKNFASTKVQHN
ncbi:MAG: hypothetical protein ACK4NC_03425 [Candidatus Gracilibacteria bacterium]